MNMVQVDSKVRKASLAKIAEGSPVEGEAQSQEQRVNLRNGQYAEVQPTDSKCQVSSIIRLAHTKTKMQYEQ